MRARDADTFKTHVFFGVKHQTLYPGVKFSGKTVGLLYFALTCIFQPETGLQKTKVEVEKVEKVDFSRSIFQK